MLKIKKEKVAHCLNCGIEPVEDAEYCHSCGQSTKTRPFSIWEFFRRELVQILFSDEKGFFYSLRQLLTHPGKMVFGYVEGKRAFHVPFGSFYMVILGFLVLVSYFSELHIVNVLEIEEEDTGTRKAFEFIEDSPKFINIIQIPIMAFFSWMVFWKAPLNFSEHLVLSVYRGAMELLFLTIPSLMGLLMASLYLQEIGYFASIILSTIYSIWLYIGFFGNYYKGKIKVIVLSFICYGLFIFIGGTILMLSLKWIVAL